MLQIQTNPSWKDLDVGDPSDWTQEYKVMRPLDSSLRCELCFDIFNAPVSLKSCNHIFCSTCIRTHINQPGNSSSFCPKCRNSRAFDSELVPQPCLENTAESWRNVRPFIMKQQERIKELERKLEQAEASMRSAVAGGAEEAQDPYSSKRRKVQHEAPRTGSTEGKTTSSDDAAEGDDVPDCSKRRSKRIRGWVTNARSEGSSADNAFVVSDDEGEGGGGSRLEEGLEESEYEEDGESDRKRQKVVETSRNGEGNVKEPDHLKLQASDMVQCPICCHEFTMAALNVHLDKGGCSKEDPPPSAHERGGTTVGRKVVNAATTSSWFSRGGSSNNPSSSSSSSSNLVATKKLTRPPYHLKTERDLRKLLESLNLPTTGDKEKLSERHRQYVNLFNANLDSNPIHRKTET
ncbi:hypothetical protein IE53DRAFT_390958, partial [Violaceomyces palustris]